MTISISIVVAALIALSVWLIFSVKKTKTKTRYTKDEDKKSFSDTAKMLGHLKDKIPKKIEEEQEVINETIPNKEKEKKTKKKKPATSEKNKPFNLKDAIIASELLKRKTPKNH